MKNIKYVLKVHTVCRKCVAYKLRNIMCISLALRNYVKVTFNKCFRWAEKNIVLGQNWSKLISLVTNLNVVHTCLGCNNWILQSWNHYMCILITEDQIFMMTAPVVLGMMLMMAQALQHRHQLFTGKRGLHSRSCDH